MKRSRPVPRVRGLASGAGVRESGPAERGSGELGRAEERAKWACVGGERNWARREGCGPQGREGETWAALGRLGFLGWVGFLFIWVFLFSISKLFYS